MKLKAISKQLMAAAECLKGIAKEESCNDSKPNAFSFTRLLMNGTEWNETDQDQAATAATIPAVLLQSDFEINPPSNVAEENIIAPPSPVAAVDKTKKKRSKESSCITTTPQRKDEKQTKRKKSAGRAKDQKTKADESLSENTETMNCSLLGKENSKPGDGVKDYIHVRARRGQATDSHSLAERVRREKISERMKTLQDLVPGCSKVTGKAVMLDEIINYVQSLQRQVEFLSMKLAAVKPAMSLYMDLYLDTEAADTKRFNDLHDEEELQQQAWQTTAAIVHHQQSVIGS